jgi:hypothetical protein
MDDADSAPPYGRAQSDDEQDSIGSAPGRDDEEESIEEYMARLLNRMRSGAGGKGGGEPVARDNAPSGVAKTSKAAAPIETKKTSFPPAQGAAAAAEGDKAVPAEPADEPPAQGRMTELGPRTARAEALDLVGMRELANSQARAAIHTHRHETSRRNALTKWIMSGGSLLLTLGGLLWLPSDNGTLRNGLIAGVVVAILWGWQAVAATRRVLKMKESQAKPLPSGGGGASASR